MNDRIKTWGMFLLIVVLAGALRLWKYEYFPIGGETADESAWTLLGASLIQEKVPASWSYFAAYESYHYVEGVFDAPIVRPVLDHPPLFSLFPGTAHSLKSFWLDSPSFKVIRFPMVIMGAVNVGLFWLLVRKIFARTEWVGLATILFMTIPEIVFGSRLVVAENLLVTWIITTMLVAVDKPSRSTVLKLILLCVLAVLTKVAGLIIPVSLVIYGLLTKQKIFTRAGVMGGVIGLGLFALYGAFYNWHLFTSLFLTQSAREVGLATLQNRLFLHPTLVKHILFDGWKMLGLFSTFFVMGALVRDKKAQLVQVFTMVSLLFIALTVGEGTFHGWYDFLLWPMLVITLTLFAQKIYQEKNGIFAGIAWLFLLPSVRLALIFLDRYEGLSPFFIRGIILLGFLPLGWQILHRRQLIQPTLKIMGILLILSSLVTVFMISHEAYWLQAAFFQRPL